MQSNHLRVVKKALPLVCMVLAATLAGLFAGGVLEARTRKGDQFLKDAHAAEDRKQWDLAIDLYQKAVNEDPRDSGYLVGMARARFQAGQMHVELGKDLRSQGKLADAIGEFQRAILIDPSSSIALQELRRTQEMLAQPTGTPQANLTPAERAELEVAARTAAILGLPELNPPRKRVGPVRMNSTPINILFSTVANLAGITIVWDPTWQNRPTRNWDVEIPEMAVEEALDYLATVTRAYWKPVNATTIFITEESTAKRRDFEDTVVKTFFITNAASVQEFQEISTAVRTITDLRRVYTYNALKAMVVRGPADAVALAEKLIRDLDRPKPEVVVDVVIMQVNSARSRDLAATLASNGKLGINVPINFAPQGATTTTTGNTTTTSNVVNLPRIGRLSVGDFAMTLPGMLLQAMMSDTATKVLSSPQVRASDGQKGRLEIGDRVPIASGSFTSGVGGVAPGVNTQFQYIPVGVIVDINPQIHSTNEVTLHIELELSQVKSFNDIGGILQPVIGQTKTTADFRMQEGEINILSGLTQAQDTTTISGIPGLVNIPVLGRVFGGESITKDRSELVIALVPHIVRTPDYSSENLRGVFAGAEQQLFLRRSAPDPGADGAAPAAQGAAVTTPAPTPTTQPAKPVVPPTTAPQAANAPPATPPPAAPPGAGARVAFQPGIVTVAANTPFALNVQLENAANIASISPIRVTWDPMLMRLNDIAPGELMSRDGGRVTSVKDIRNDTGQATLTISRPAGSPGVTGSGPLTVLTFTALASGSGRVTVSEMVVTDAQGRPVQATLGTVPVAIQ